MSILGLQGCRPYCSVRERKAPARSRVSAAALSLAGDPVHQLRHLLFVLLDGGSQFELVSGAHEIVFRILDFVIGVSVEIIAQEAEALFEGDQPAAEGEVIDLGGIKKSPGHREVAPSEGREHTHLHPDQGQVGLVLSCGAGGAAHHVAEIVEGAARHDSVEVDDAEGLAAGIIEEDVIELGVVVGDAFGHGALAHEIDQYGCDAAALQGEIDLLPAVRGASGAILLHRPFEIGKAESSVVKIGDGLVQPAARQIDEGLLEAGKGGSGEEGLLRRLDDVAGVGALDEEGEAPAAPLRIDVAIAAAACRQVLQYPAVDLIGPALRQFQALVLRDPQDVLHQPVRVFENGGVDALQHIAAPALPGGIVEAVGVIDVTGAEGGATAEGARQLESPGDLLQPVW